MRLSYCFPEPDRIREGVRRLAGVIEEEVELRATFGSAAAPHPLDGPEQAAPGPDICMSTARDLGGTRRRPRRRPLARARRVAAFRSPRRRRVARRRCRGRGARRRRDAASPSLVADPPAAVFPVLHGAAGEDGAVREVLDALRHPLRRCRARRLPGRVRQAGREVDRCAAFGVATPDAFALPHSVFRELGAPAVLDAIVAQLGLPLVVKPTRGGSALGASVVRDVARAARRDGRLLRVRRHRADRAATSPAPRSPCRSSTPATASSRCRSSRSFPTAASTTTPRATTRAPPSSSCPRACPTTQLDAASKVALQAHEALGLRDLSRSDLDRRRRRHGAGSSRSTSRPGMTETSLLPQSARPPAWTSASSASRCCAPPSTAAEAGHADVPDDRAQATTNRARRTMSADALAFERRSCHDAVAVDATMSRMAYVDRLGVTRRRRVGDLARALRRSRNVADAVACTRERRTRVIRPISDHRRCADGSSIADTRVASGPVASRSRRARRLHLRTAHRHVDVNSCGLALDEVRSCSPNAVRDACTSTAGPPSSPSSPPASSRSSPSRSRRCSSDAVHGCSGSSTATCSCAFAARTPPRTTAWCV